MADQPPREVRNLVVIEEGKRGRTLADFPAAEDAATHRAIAVEAAQHLIAWAKDHGLDAWENHVVLIYGKPYVTFRGQLHRATQHPSYKGYRLTRISKEEKLREGFSSGDEVTLAEVYRQGWDHPVTAFGQVNFDERVESESQIAQNVLEQATLHAQGRDRWGKPVAGWLQEEAKKVLADPKAFNREVHRRMMAMPLHKNPKGMADKRALATALDRAFPLGLALAEEVRGEKSQPG